MCLLVFLEMLIPPPPPLGELQARAAEVILHVFMPYGVETALGQLVRLKLNQRT